MRSPVRSAIDSRFAYRPRRRGGRANEAIVRLLAEALGVRVSAIAITQGHAAPLKVVRVEFPGSTAGKRLEASPFA